MGKQSHLIVTLNASYPRFLKKYLGGRFWPLGLYARFYMILGNLNVLLNVWGYKGAFKLVEPLLSHPKSRLESLSLKLFTKYVRQEWRRCVFKIADKVGRRG